jgi:tetratricopeptide (TPR) repeat protein
LRNLGRIDEAVEAYNENIRRAEQLGDIRQVAVGKGQLGTVRIIQHQYPEALVAYVEALDRFTELDEPRSVATTWHQIGIVYQKSGQPELAEDAYRKSLAIKVRLGDVAGQSRTLTELGNLYDDALDRPEEAASFYRRAVEKSVEIGDTAQEGRGRNNLAITLSKLQRYEEARREIHRAIDCNSRFGHAAAPWMSWHVATRIEVALGNRAAVAEARRETIASYLAYRRDGGENHFIDGRISVKVTQLLLAGSPTDAAERLQHLAANPDATGPLRAFVQALQAVVAGSRDRALADAPDLNYTMAAEILLLMETLEAAEG